MKEKYAEIIGLTIFLIIFVGVLFLCFSVIRDIEINPTKKEYCNYFYGTSEYNDNLCVIIYNDSSIDFKHIPNYTEMNNLCEIPDFWELSKWSNKCSYNSEEKKG